MSQSCFYLFTSSCMLLFPVFSYPDSVTLQDPVLGWRKRKPIWSSAVLAHPPECSMCALRHVSARPGCEERFFDFLEPSCQLEPVRQFSSAIFLQWPWRDKYGNTTVNHKTQPRWRTCIDKDPYWRVRCTRSRFFDLSLWFRICPWFPVCCCVLHFGATVFLPVDPQHTGYFQ